jgi:hypothetical protein
MPSAIRFKLAIVSVAQQRVVVDVRLEINAPTMAAVPARWPTPRNVFLAAKGHAAVPAVSGLHEYFRLINKHNRILCLRSASMPDEKWEMVAACQLKKK